MTMMQTRTPLYIVLLSAVGLFAGACSQGNGTTQQAKGASGAGRAANSVPVETFIVQPQPLENKIATTGTLLANEEVELHAELAGRITGVFFAEGKRVKKGDVLIKLNDRELRAQLDRKKLEEQLAADQERRSKRLFDVAGLSQEEYDKVLNNLKMIQAEREEIESQLAETEIVAPFDGIVGLRSVSEGQYISTTDPVAAMQDIDPIKVEFSVPEKYAAKLVDGTRVRVLVGESTEGQTGVIYATEAKIDPNTRTIKSRAKIPNPHGTLIPGSFAKVEVTLQKIPDALVIPAAAIVPELSGQKVYIAQGGKAKAVPVETGIRTEDAVQITNGLNANDTVITTGLLQITDGKPVQILPSSSK